jgi:hypothetical protein
MERSVTVATRAVFLRVVFEIEHIMVENVYYLDTTYGSKRHSEVVVGG